MKLLNIVKYAVLSKTFLLDHFHLKDPSVLKLRDYGREWYENCSTNIFCCKIKIALRYKLKNKRNFFLSNIMEIIRKFTT